MSKASSGFLPTLWSRLNGCDSQSLAQDEQVELIKREILQNITLILNSRSHLSAQELRDEELQYSVLGLGLADFCGHNHNQAQLAELKQQICEQIIHFEPRLDPESIEINLLDEENKLGPNTPNYVNLEIKARLKNALSAELFTCISKLDLDSGNNAVSQSSQV